MQEALFDLEVSCNLCGIAMCDISAGRPIPRKYVELTVCASMRLLKIIEDGELQTIRRFSQIVEAIDLLDRALAGQRMTSEDRVQASEGARVFQRHATHLREIREGFWN